MAAKWLIRDEVSEGANAVLETVDREGAVVPALFPFELENVLLVAERRSRIDASELVEALNLIKRLNITVEPFHVGTMGKHLDVARRFRLTSYDAAYALIALRRGLALATADKYLGEAARKLEIETLLIAE